MADIEPAKGLTGPLHRAAASLSQVWRPVTRKEMNVARGWTQLRIARQALGDSWWRDIPELRSDPFKGDETIGTYRVEIFRKERNMRFC